MGNVNLKLLPAIVLTVALGVLPTIPASANNLGENQSWQFDTSADKVNKAYLEDLRQKHLNGYYAAPIYNTYISRQYNCSVSADAIANSSSSTAIASSPTTTGHSSSSLGNSNASSIDSGYGSGQSSSSSSQSNSGSVGASTSGRISTTAGGGNDQVLNTEQTNSGNQYASVEGSAACLYGALN